MPYMYILECHDRSFYTGSTWDVFARLDQHQRGEGSSFTRRRRPVRLVYYEEFDLVVEAYYREQQVQKLRRGDKRRLIADGPGVRPT